MRDEAWDGQHTLTHKDTIQHHADNPARAFDFLFSIL